MPSTHVRLAPLIVGALTLVVLSTSAERAQAADPYRPRVNGQAPMTDIERWSGFYLGASLGYAAGRTDMRNGFGHTDLTGTGWLGSVYAGYNWRFGSMIAGVEADLGTGSYSGSQSVSGLRFDTNLQGMASMRVRLGLLATDNLLLYGTGGRALARMHFGVRGGGSANDTLKGYQIGLGGEYKFNPNWSLKLEYIYTDLKEHTRALGGAQTRFDPDDHSVRAGISFKF